MWKDNNLLSKFNETTNEEINEKPYRRSSDDNLFKSLNESLRKITSHKFASDLRKPVIVVHKTEGIYYNNNSFQPRRHYTVGDDMTLTGIAMYNIPEGMENKDPDSWDISEGLTGKGWGLLLSAIDTNYKKIVPVKGTRLNPAIKYLKKDCTDDDIKKANFYRRNWRELFLLSFNPEDFDKLYADFKKEEAGKGIFKQWDGTLEEPIEKIEELIAIAAEDIKKKIKEDRLKNEHLIGTPKKTKEYAKTNWIEKGYPCAKREGFRMYGAKAKEITTPQALKGIEKCLDIDIEMLNGVHTLVLGFYSGADLL